MTTISVKQVAFGAGQSISDRVDLSGTTAIVGLIMPTANWKDAVVSVQGSPDGINFFDMYDGVAAKELVFNVRMASLVMLNPNRMRCCKAVSLRSGTHDAPIVQPQTCLFGVVVEMA
jgi:hypothetical protein